MSRPRDGEEWTIGGRPFVALVDEDSGTAGWVCGTCEEYVGWGEDAVLNHECRRCSNCDSLLDDAFPADEIKCDDCAAVTA